MRRILADRLCVIATDAKAPDDFAAYCQQSGDVLAESTRDWERFRFVVQTR